MSGSGDGKRGATAAATVPSWRFCATVLNGYEKPARQELAAKLEAWAPLELHSTKVGRIFFTLGALRLAGAGADSEVAAAALCALAGLETVEHLFVVTVEGDYAMVDGKPVQRGAEVPVEAPAAGLEDSAVLTMVAQHVSAAQWVGAAEVARALRALLVAAASQQGPEPEPERAEEARVPKLPKFRVDVKSGASGGRAKSSIRRAAGVAFASGVASATGWEPDLAQADIPIWVFLNVAGNPRIPQVPRPHPYQPVLSSRGSDKTLIWNGTADGSGQGHNRSTRYHQPQRCG
jgi:hypothetical protein